MSPLAPHDRVLIVLTGSLGDVARGARIVAPLDRYLEQGSIAWLVDERWAPLVRRIPGVDHLISFARSELLRSVPRVRRAMRAFNPTVTLDLQRNAKSGTLSFLSGAPRRIAWHRRDGKEGNAFFATETIARLAPRVSKMAAYESFLSHLGVSPLPAGTAWLSVERAREERIVMVWGAAWSSKRLPPPWYRWCVAELRRSATRFATLPIVWVGDARMRGEAEALAAEIPGIDNRVGTTSLEDLIEIVGSASLVISPDSGPAHVAAACGAPVITLFGPTDPRWCAPYGNEQLVLTAELGCRPCGRRVCPGLQSLCLRLTTPQQLTAALSRVPARS